jgi:predicted extracellular nuclease
LFVKLVSVWLAWQSGVEAQVVINEVDYDQPSTDAAEFIELRNLGAGSVELSGYALRLINGASGGAAQYANLVLPSFNLAPGAYYVICANAAAVPDCDLDVTPNTDLAQNGAADALALMLNGVAVDRVSYEGDVPGFTEGTGAPADTAGAAESLSRCPNGADTDDNSEDFQLRPITPGAANNCGGGGVGDLGACGDPATLISAIQGDSNASPLVGQTHVIEGVVVGDFQEHGINGFFVQEEDSDNDANPSTSEGIFVFEGALAVPVADGNRVRVLGDVIEFDSLTELTHVQVLVCPGSPAATTQMLALPVANLGDLERYEGMRVSFSQTLTVTGNFEWGRFGSLDLSANGRLVQPTQIASPGGAASARQALNDRSRIVLDDGETAQNPNPIPYKALDNTRRLGSTLSSLTGVLDGRFGAYRIQPTLAPSFANANPRQAAPGAVGGRIRVASFNVLNFFSTLDEGAFMCGPSGNMECRGADTALELQRQRTKLLNALEILGADIVGLIEIENNPSAAVQSLVDGLNARLGAGSYAFVNTGSIGTDAIKLAFLYKPAKVVPSGAHALLDSSVDPRFIDTRNRPALAQTFREVATNAKLTVINNHLKSKGSACGAGDDDPLDGQGNCNGTRTLAAEALLDWIATDPTASNDPDFLLIGDLNSYAMEDPIATLEAGGLTNLERSFVGAGAYSYQFAGQSGTLDYALANAALVPQVTGASIWHINSDEPVIMNYNLEFKTDDPFDISDPFGASDHDPLVVGLNLTCGASAPALPAIARGITAVAGDRQPVRTPARRRRPYR